MRKCCAKLGFVRASKIAEVVCVWSDQLPADLPREHTRQLLESLDVPAAVWKRMYGVQSLADLTAEQVGNLRQHLLTLKAQRDYLRKRGWDLERACAELAFLAPALDGANPIAEIAQTTRPLTPEAAHNADVTLVDEPVMRDVPQTMAAQTLPLSPTSYLMNWRAILDALDLRNTKEERTRVRQFNERLEGPIALPGKGGQPKVNKVKLLEWWNHLEIRFLTLGGGDNKQATVHARHNYGRDATVLPDISGHVKTRREKKSDQ